MKIELDAKTLKAALAYVKAASGKDDTLPALMGIVFMSEGNDLLMYGCDGYRVNLARFMNVLDGNEHISILCDVPTLPAGNYGLMLETDDKTLSITGDHATTSVTIKAHQPFDARSIINETREREPVSTDKIDVNPVYLADAVKRLKASTATRRRRSNPITISFGGKLEPVYIHQTDAFGEGTVAEAIVMPIKSE